MTVPDDVERVGAAAERLRGLRKQYEHALSRYGGVPKTDAAKEAAVPDVATAQGYSDAEARRVLDADHDLAYRELAARAEETMAAVKEAYDAARTVREHGRLDSAAERARYSTAYDAVDPGAAVEQIVEDVKTLAEIDAETIPQTGIGTAAIHLVDDVSLPHTDTPKGDADRADRTYLDMSEAEQDAELERILDGDDQSGAQDSFDPGWTTRA